MEEQWNKNALLSRYFECVDPVYPLLHKQSFYMDYAQFWSLPREEQDRADPAFVALMLVMLALGMQFVTINTPAERKRDAEFYASAANQAPGSPDGSH